MPELNRERLIQLLSMFGSSAVGERANAASLADSMVRRAGLTWGEVLRGINPDEPERMDVATDVVKALNHKIERYRQDVSRLEEELEAARRHVHSLTEQLERERQSIEHERAAWSKEREALRQMGNAERPSGRNQNEAEERAPNIDVSPGIRRSQDLPTKSHEGRAWWERRSTKALVLVMTVGVVAFACRNQLQSWLPEQWRTVRQETTVVPKLIRSPVQQETTAAPKPIRSPRIEFDMLASSVELEDGRYVMRGQLVNAGTVPGSTTALRLVFRKGDDVLGERTYPLVEGPIVPGQRLSFTRPFEDPPDGTTNVVPSVE
jgi:hypothetical protein